MEPSGDGQEALTHKSLKCQLEGMLGAAYGYKIRKLRSGEGKELEGSGDKRLRSHCLAWNSSLVSDGEEQRAPEEGGVELSEDTHTKLPRALHSPALQKLSPRPVAATHAPTPGSEAAQLPAAEAPPTCNKPMHTQARCLWWGAGLGCGVSGEGLRMP